MLFGVSACVASKINCRIYKMIHPITYQLVTTCFIPACVCEAVRYASVHMFVLARMVQVEQVQCCFTGRHFLTGVIHVKICLFREFRDSLLKPALIVPVCMTSYIL